MPSFDKQQSTSHGPFKSTISTWQSLNTFQKHKQLLSHYPRLNRPIQSKSLTEAEILKQNHCFIRDELEDANTWESRLARKYYVQAHLILE